MFFGSLQIYAQQQVITNNASNPNTCDGSAIFIDTNITNSWIWTNVSTNMTFSPDQSFVYGLCAGDYILTYLDSNNMQINIQFQILAPDCSDFQISTQTISPSTNLSNDGAIYATVSGNNNGLTFIWSNGETTSSIINLAEGEYAVCAYNELQCESCTTVQLIADTILNPCNDLFIDVIITQAPSSPSSLDGEAYISFSGGTAPYSLIYTYNNEVDTLLSSGTSSFPHINLGEGILCYNVIDANGCSVDDCEQIVASGNPCDDFFATTYTTPSNNYSPFCNGSATISVSGGTAPYLIDFIPIDGNESSQLELCAGTYYFMVHDALNCSFSGSYTIGLDIDTNLIQDLNVTINTNNVYLSGLCDGNVYIEISGGIPPYTILNQEGIVISNYLSNQCEGIYSIIVFDASGQQIAINYFIASPNQIIDNNFLPDSTIVDTLMNNLIENCDIDFSSIDTAFLANVNVVSLDSIIVSWNIIDANGVTEILQNYSLDAGFGVYQLILEIFCPQRAQGDYLIVKEQFKISNLLSQIENSQTNKNWKVYPNPFSENLQISFEIDKATRIQITDLQGRIILNQRFEDSNIMLNTQNWEKGTYLIHIQNELINESKTVVKF